MSRAISGLLQIVSVVVGSTVGGPLGAFLMVALSVGARLTAPKAKQQARQASVTSLSFGEVPRAAAIGLPE
jgi:hypothetical protein